MRVRDREAFDDEYIDRVELEEETHCVEVMTSDGNEIYITGDGFIELSGGDKIHLEDLRDFLQLIRVKNNG